jgi:hypothetical protein
MKTRAFTVSTGCMVAAAIGIACGTREVTDDVPAASWPHDVSIDLYVESRLRARRVRGR